VAKSQPDGYTLLATDETTFINRYLYGKLSYDPAKDFVAITGLGLTHLALAVHPSFPARDIADLIAAAKAAAGDLNYATFGVGSSSHLSIAAEKTSQRTGKPARRFKQFKWTTRTSWSRERRVVAKAEWTQGEANPRFVVTSLTRAESSRAVKDQWRNS
jgi:hypothetical protein